MFSRKAYQLGVAFKYVYFTTGKKSITFSGQDMASGTFKVLLTFTNILSLITC